MYEYELLAKKLAVLETARECADRCRFCLKTDVSVEGPHERAPSGRIRTRTCAFPGFETVYFIDLNLRWCGKGPWSYANTPQEPFALVLPDPRQCRGRWLLGKCEYRAAL